MSSGYVHSIEVGSFVDGPGARVVVFFTGCPLHCVYCHNIDVCRARGRLMSAEQIVDRVSASAAFLRSSGGGLTLSGGEPLAQPEFAADVLRGTRHLGVHTAIETSGYLGERVDAEMLGLIDLVILDIKSWDPETYRRVTGVELEPTLAFARRLADVCKPTWVRFVLVPGLTDAPENVSGLARFVAGLGNVERVEIIPFHQMGQHKWEALGLPYTLENTQPPSPEDLERATSLFEAEGVSVGITRLAPCESNSEQREMSTHASGPGT
jgi:pyruvate formate lyase activating enzyme